MCDPECCADIEPDDEVEGLRVNVRERLRTIAAGVVDENTKTVDFRNTGDQLVRGDVSGPGLNPPGLVCADTGQVVRGSRYSNNPGTGVRQSFGTGSSDSTTGAGDERNLLSERAWHIDLKFAFECNNAYDHVELEAAIGDEAMKQPKNTSKNNDKQNRKRATSYDVAELAGVSQSAVSRVFQDGASASKVMRDRVMAAADKLGYRPNAIARGLITQRSNMVAVVISKLTNLYYPEVLVELTQRFSDHDVRVLLFALERESDTSSVIDKMLQYRVDGIVTAAMVTPKQLKTIASADIPVVLYNRTLKDPLVSSVRCDQEEGERWLVDELVRAGHKSFGIVEGPADSVVGIERKMGALNELVALGITDITSVGGDYGYETGRQCFAELVQKHGSPPDAVIAANDVMAIGCIDEARETFGLRVPEDISIVGFDGVGPARYSAYDVTTVRQPVHRMAESAVTMLVERIENPDLSPEKRAFSGMLIRGGSARLPATDD